MAEGGFDDFEMKEISRKYPEYENMNEQELNDEYASLTNERLNLLNDPNKEDDAKDIKERITYIDCILEKRQGNVLDSLGATVERPEYEIRFAIEDCIKRNYSEGFRLDVKRCD